MPALEHTRMAGGRPTTRQPRTSVLSLHHCRQTPAGASYRQSGRGGRKARGYQQAIPTDPLCRQSRHKHATPQSTAAPGRVRELRSAPQPHDPRASTLHAEIAPSHPTCAARSMHRHAYDSAHSALLRYGRLGRCTSASHRSVALHWPPEGLRATSWNGRVHCLSSIIPRS
jgi:hypothetical protein